MSNNSTTKQNWFKRHKIWTVVIALLILCSIGAAASGNNNQTNTTNKTASTSSKSSTTNTASTTQSAASSTPKMNQQANDGKFGFTVTSLQCNVPEITQPDDSYENDTSGAPYCLMNVSVKGISTVAQTFESDSQYIYDASGKQYSVDDQATIAANNSSSDCMEDPTVNPGVTITCTLAFDVPASVTPTTATLHDSAASDGVKVGLEHN